MSKLLKTEIKNRIVDLRKHGYSIPEISQILKITKTSAYRYAKNIPILREFQQRLTDRRNASKIMSERNWEYAHAEATKLIGGLTSRERKLIACSLYWAEGNKKDFNFTNTDSSMIAVFMDILRTEFAIKDESFKISIRTYEDLDKQKCIDFWSFITKIDLRDNVSINVLNGKKSGKLKYGMCRVRIKKGGLMLKKIFAINKLVHNIISPHSSMDRMRHS